MSIGFDKDDASAWADGSKLVIDALDGDLAESVTTGVYDRVRVMYNTAAWVGPSSTPSLIRKIMAMQYVAWLYERTYSEDGAGNTYANRLFLESEMLLNNLVSGVIVLEDVPSLAGTTGLGSPLYEVTEPVFTMGQIW